MVEACRDFSSDNITPVAPEIMAAIQAANTGSAHSYGDDEWTRRLTAVAEEVFGCALSVYPVATGTAANALALAALIPPHGAVYCHETAHIQTDECGAPEFFTGAKLIGFPGQAGRLTVGAMAEAFARTMERGVHQSKPAAISLSQATEWGTVYTPEAVATLAAFAHERGMGVHMDGARFANAVAHLGCTPAAVTWQAGVDVLSLGATKNGCLAAEAVVIFNSDVAAQLEYRRKRAGQLFSKMRFASAQMAAYLDDGLWLRYAANANRMAARLAAGLAGIEGVRLVEAVDANELFVALPQALAVALQARGYGFYHWPADGERPGEVVIRLVTAWSTTAADVDGLIEALVLVNKN
jgi:threonine aldolase